MEISAGQIPEPKTDELLEALKVISGIIAGPELRSIKDFVRMTDEARQAEQAAFEQKMESALAQIREDAMGISADLRHTKENIESDRRKWHEDIASVRDILEKARKDLSDQVANTVMTMQAEATRLQEQIEATQIKHQQDSNERISAMENRVAQCENEGNARRAQNSRLAKSMRVAAQSLVAGAAEDAYTTENFGEQVDTILSALDDKTEEKESDNLEVVINQVDS
jgi:hypothetical protein